MASKSMRVGLVALVGLASAFVAGSVVAENASVEFQYNFTLAHTFGQRSYTANSFGQPVQFTENHDVIMDIARFDADLGMLESVDVVFSTSEATYNLVLTVSRSSWSGNVTRKLQVTSLDPGITFSSDAGAEAANGFGGQGAFNANIGGASVNFTQAFSDAESLAAFTGVSSLQWQISSSDIFALELFKTASQTGTGTVSAPAGNYAGTVTVTYNYSAVPEPGVVGLMGVGLVVVFGARWVMRRRMA